MKKLLFAIAFGGLLAQLGFAQIYKNQKEMLGLRGSVKTIVWEDAKIVFENGKYVEKERYGRRTETYDLMGNLIKEDPVPPTEGRPLVCVNGKCNIEEPKQKYKYNEQGKVIEETSVLTDGTVTSKREFDYDPQGRLLEWRFYYQNKAGKLYFAGKWIYERQANQTKSTYYEGCCEVKRWRIAVFDKYKNVTELSLFRADGWTSKSAYSYEYDPQGNWIKRVISNWVTKDGKSSFEPVEVGYRKFTYYYDETRLKQ